MATNNKERLLVTQALDERDLLMKKIKDKIDKARFVDTKKCNEDRVMDARVSHKEFVKDVTSTYQTITDLTRRYERIQSAIIASNAQTTIETSVGTITIASAIATRTRLRGQDHFASSTDFETMLLQKLRQDLSEMITRADANNRKLQMTADDMRMSILGKDAKVKEEKPLEVVDTFVKENTTEVVDPLNGEKLIADLIEQRDHLLAELDTKIKVSNATTYVEI